MSFKEYLQNDSRWAGKAYAGETMAAAGCGPTSVGCVVDKLPSTVADYITLIGGASSGHGTEWNAITKAVEHFGYQCDQLCLGDYRYISDNGITRNKWLAQMKTGKYYGILLMGAGYFTQSGHYIAVKSVDSGNNVTVWDVIYPPRSGVRAWNTYFEGDVKIFYLIRKKDTPEDTSYKFTPAQIYPNVKGADKWVRLCQRILKARGIYKGKIDGSYGGATTEAVKEYQRRRGLKVDGNCGVNTWTDMLGMVGTTKTLRQIKTNMTGVDVLLWQEILASDGLYKGGLDRFFGGGTYDGTVKWQAAHGLTADGVVGPKTWAKALS